MKRFLKWFIGILLFLIVVVVGLALSLPYLVDPNKYKPDIIAQIKPYMHGRDLKIPGKIKISVFPWLGVDIGDTVVGNADGFVLKPFMTIKNARAHVRLLSLLTDSPEIGSLDMEGVVVNLQRDAEGRDNWSDLSKASTPTRPPAKTPSAGATVAAAPAMLMARLKIDGVHLKNASINFEDNKNKNDIIISKLNVDAGPINQLNPIPVRGQLNYYSKNQGLVAASAFATTVSFKPDDKVIDLMQLVINTNVTGEALNNKTVTTSFKTPVLNVNLTQETVDAKPFQLGLNKMQSDGKLHLKRFSNPSIQLTMHMKELDLDSLLPAPKPAADSNTPDSATAASPAIFAALIPLKTADMQGTLSFDKLKYHGLQFSDVRLGLLARGGLISALPDAKLYDGTYHGDIQINVKTLPVSIRLRQEMRNVPMGPITLAFTGKQSMTGKANFDGQFFSSGNTLDDVTRNLNGDASFHIHDVQLTLVDVEQLVLQQWYDKLKLAGKQDANKKVTAFDTIRGTIRVVNGIAVNRDFSAVSQRVHLSGSGQTSLVTRTIKYTLYTIPKKSFVIKLGNSSVDLKNKRLPTYINGTWSNPEVKYDLGGLMQAGIQNRMDEKKQEARDNLKTKIENEKDKLKDKLQNLLKR